MTNWHESKALRQIRGTFPDVACLYDRTARNWSSHASSARAGRSRQSPVKVGRSTRQCTRDGAGDSAVSNCGVEAFAVPGCASIDPVYNFVLSLGNGIGVLVLVRKTLSTFCVREPFPCASGGSGAAEDGEGHFRS
jgi:hypothetical protein